MMLPKRRKHSESGRTGPLPNLFSQIFLAAKNMHALLRYHLVDARPLITPTNRLKVTIFPDGLCTKLTRNVFV